MVNLRSHFTKKFVGLSLLTLIIFFSKTHIDNVKADIAPPDPPSGTAPIPGNKITNVRMVSETVIIKINEASAARDGFARVEATFTMRNLGDEEEQMEVRFPLDQTLGWGGICEYQIPFLTPISDLKATVNEEAIATQLSYETITLPALEEPYPTKTIPCWAEFPVSFPVGEDVIIQVTYTAEPYDAYASYTYAYVLKTGKGWEGTIGSAEIIFQVPYELNSLNYIDCFPTDCEVGANEVRWHYEDFEPESNISVSLLPLPIWKRIQAERKNIAENSNDGEAWGRLAKAYKESIRATKGFRSDEGGVEIYQLSKNAYRKAVSLLPKDADLQYDYADLLCWNAEWNNFFVDSEVDAWRECVVQYQQVYNLEPEYEELNELLQFVEFRDDVEMSSIIDFSGSVPDFLILTPQPTETTTPTEKPTQVVAIATITASPTIEITKTATATTMVDEVTETPVPEKKREESNSLIYFGGAMLLFVAVFVFIKFKKS